MPSTIKSMRLSGNISVNELARRLGVTASAVSQLERSEAEGTIKLNSLRDALAALGANLRITAGPATSKSKFAPYRVADSMSDSLLNKGDPTFALRLLTFATSQLEENPESIDQTELEIAPTPLPDMGWDTLFRAAYAHSIAAKIKPAWTQAPALSKPWFVSQYPILRERAKTTTPDYLRRLNIFIDARSLSRA